MYLQAVVWTSVSITPFKKSRLSQGREPFILHVVKGIGHFVSKLLQIPSIYGELISLA